MLAFGYCNWGLLKDLWQNLVFGTWFKPRTSKYSEVLTAAWHMCQSLQRCILCFHWNCTAIVAVNLIFTGVTPTVYKRSTLRTRLCITVHTTVITAMHFGTLVLPDDGTMECQNALHWWLLCELLYTIYSTKLVSCMWLVLYSMMHCICSIKILQVCWLPW